MFDPDVQIVEDKDHLDHVVVMKSVGQTLNCSCFIYSFYHKIEFRFVTCFAIKLLVSLNSLLERRGNNELN